MFDLNLTNLTTLARSPEFFVSNLTTLIHNTTVRFLNTTTKSPRVNFTIFEENRNPFLNFDNKAKEIILLSTAFATLLLSICFLIFIVWFCCITVLKDKNIKSTAKKVKKSLKESENNVHQMGGFKTLKKTSEQNDIYVRDDSETKSPRKKSIPLSLFTKQEKPSEDTISYHAYDILDISTKNLSTPDSELSKKEKFKQKLNQELNRGSVNHGFIGDETNSKRYIDFNTQSTQALNKALRNKKSGHVSKNSTLRNQPKLTREQIEREFYEYTLECRKKLNELFVESPSSSDTIRDSSSSEKEKIKNDYNSLKLKFKRPCLSSSVTKKTKKTEQIWQI